MTTTRGAAVEPEHEEAADRNDVALVGRVAAAAVEHAMPSGDLFCTWRLVVRREGDRRRRGAVRSPTVDTLDCVAWRADVRRVAAGWRPGDVVAVSGSLRRRFWRVGAGSASRYEVEVHAARRLRRP
ncbi:MAG: hypothetical protein NVSMB13_18410 [Mycobacteriales bacterium]